MAKKKVKDAVEEVDDNLEESIDELTEAIVEELKERHTEKIEPVELYSEKARMKLHEDFNRFRQRFSRGYHLLLEEIERKAIRK